MGKYNGWSNYETWVCHLWFSNEEASWNYWNSLAIDKLKSNKNDKHQAIYDLAMDVKAFIINNIPIAPASFYSDIMLQAALEIDYTEIAKAFIEGVTAQT